MSLVARNKENYSFRDRLEYGLKFENTVETTFKKLGLPIYPYGLGSLPDVAKEELIKLNDPTSLLLRFAPDFFCVTEQFSFFIECKSSMEQTPNYSYNLDCYNAGLELARLGIKILTIFDGLHAQWVHKLRLSRVCEGSSKGSGKPYILIPKKDLPDLFSFLSREQIKGNRTQRSRLALNQLSGLGSFPDFL